MIVSPLSTLLSSPSESQSSAFLLEKTCVYYQPHFSFSVAIADTDSDSINIVWVLLFCLLFCPEPWEKWLKWRERNAGQYIKVGFNSSWPNKDQTKLVTGKYIVKLSADIWSDGGGCSQGPAAGQCLLCYSVTRVTPELHNKTALTMRLVWIIWTEQ